MLRGTDVRGAECSLSGVLALAVSGVHKEQASGGAGGSKEGNHCNVGR